jgi:hypothetical protein
MEELAQGELLRFIQPQPLDILSDAGCGRSVNILLLHDRVRRIHEIDGHHNYSLPCTNWDHGNRECERPRE